MAQLTNKCTDDDIEYYIKECGDILGVSQHVQVDDAKSILHYVFSEIVKYKSSSLSWLQTPNSHGGVELNDDACSNQAMHD